MIFRVAIEKQPEDEPDEAECAGGDEGHLPAEAYGQPGYGERSDDRADIGSGVKNSSGEGALFFGKPFGDGFDAGGKIRGFAEAEESASDTERKSGGSGGMSDGGETPDRDGDGVTFARAETIHQISAAEETEAVGGLKHAGDVTILYTRPAEAGFQGFCEHTEDLAVEIVDGGSEKKQGADGPTHVRCGGPWGERRGVHESV